MLRIPILRENEKPTTLYYIALKQAITSDGCSSVIDLYSHCCIAHDLRYRIGVDMWGKPSKKRDADNCLRKCVEDASWLKRFSIVAKIFWFGVKTFGVWAYVDDIDSREVFETYFFNAAPASTTGIPTEKTVSTGITRGPAEEPKEPAEPTEDAPGVVSEGQTRE